MSTPPPGYYTVAEFLNGYAAFSARMDAATRPAAEHAEQARAMARLRRVCAGDRVPPPPPPPYIPVVDPSMRRRDGGSVGGDGHIDNPNKRNPIGRPDNDAGRGLGTTRVDALPPPSVEHEEGDHFVAIFLGGFFGTLAICYAIAHMLGWL